MACTPSSPPNIETLIVETQTKPWSLGPFLDSTDIVERWGEKRNAFPRLKISELVGLYVKYSDVTRQILEQTSKDLEEIGVKVRSESFGELQNFRRRA